MLRKARQQQQHNRKAKQHNTARPNQSFFKEKLAASGGTRTHNHQLHLGTWKYISIAHQREFLTSHPKQTPKCTHQSHKHNTHERVGHQMPSLQNWDSGLKIFHGANSPHTPVSKLTQHTLTRTQCTHTHTHTCIRTALMLRNTC